MRDDLESVVMLLFRFVGSGFRLALCNVGKLATWKFVVLVPDPIVFAPWSVLLPHGRLCLTCQRTPSQVHRQREQEGRLRRRRRDTGRSRRVAAACRRSGRNARRAGPRVARFVSLANLARQSHRPSTRVDCPAHECGWLLASATSSEDGNWCFFVAIVFLCCWFSAASRQFDCGCCSETVTSLATGSERQKSRADQLGSRLLLKRSSTKSMGRSCGRPVS